jgi:AhpD family alkylhydroperoxidase
LQAAQKQYGLVPNMYARMANLPGVLSTYLHGYEAYRKQSGFTPPEQEVVLLTISRENNCEYCVAAHSMVARVRVSIPGRSPHPGV